MNSNKSQRSLVVPVYDRGDIQMDKDTVFVTNCDIGSQACVLNENKWLVYVEVTDA